METILVTGGYGFIGSNFIRYVLENTDYKVTNIDSLTYAGNIDNLKEYEESKRLCNVRTDIDDYEFLTTCLPSDKPIAVFNFAAESHVDRSIDNDYAFFKTNVISTLQFIKSIKNYLNRYDNKDFKFIHVSTDEVYGSIEEPHAFTEESCIMANSPYACSKACSDLICRSYFKTYNFPVIVTHCSNNYGPRQHSEKLIPTIIRKCMNKEEIPIYGDGTNVRDWIYVEDHCRALLSLLDKGELGETYNIGADETKSNNEIAKLICDEFNKIDIKRGDFDYNSLITYVTDRPGHDFRYAIDSTKIQKQTDWTPNTEFHKGIVNTIKWYLDNPQSYEDKRLGLME